MIATYDQTEAHDDGDQLSREAKALLSANRAAEVHQLIDTVVYSLLNTEYLNHAAKINLIFLGWLARQAENTELSS